MRNKKLFYIALAVFLLGLLAWRLTQREAASKPPPKANSHAIANATAKPPPNAPAPAAASGTPGQPSESELQALLNTPGLSPEKKQALQANPGAAYKILQLMKIRDAVNSQVLDTYGKVVDQYGNPVVGAAVKGGTLLAVSADASGGQEYTTITDERGQFSFQDVHGIKLGVRVQKEGYEFIGSWVRPDGFISDTTHPAILLMYKLQGAEPMMHTKFGDWIPYDGTPVSIDLFSGKKSVGGDLKVTLSRTPVQVVRGRDHFEWSVSIAVVGGGLIESHDPYPYEAPEAGYQPVFEFSVAKDDPHWTQKLIRIFYIHTSKGVFGRINVNLTTDSDRPDGTGLSVEAYLNPSGSRNLEFDAAQQIKP